MMTKIDSEKKIVTYMIALYCRKKHKRTITCADCRALMHYARNRLDKCPYGEKKPPCRKCATHCYRKDMRKKVRQIMRFSGPRMLLYHPVIYFKHLLR